MHQIRNCTHIREETVFFCVETVFFVFFVSITLGSWEINLFLSKEPEQNLLITDYSVRIMMQCSSFEVRGKREAGYRAPCVMCQNLIHPRMLQCCAELRAIITIIVLGTQILLNY